MYRRKASAAHLSPPMVGWQLMLIALTSIALSVASGWTTWDGLTNFTSNPVLSALITFGIQGVLLVTAWMIGGQLFRRVTTSSNDILHRRSLGISRSASSAGWSALLIPLLMFIATMMLSVFFSFDSLFQSVYSRVERERASETRTSAVTADILSRQLQFLNSSYSKARVALLVSQDWNTYSAGLEQLKSIAHTSTTVFRTRRAAETSAARKQYVANRGSLSNLEARLRANAAQAGKLDRKIAQLEGRIEDETARLVEDRKALRKSKEGIIQLETEAHAERMGLGNTGRAGEGPRYRKLMKKLVAAKLRRELLEKRIVTADDELVGLRAASKKAALRAASMAGAMAELKARIAAIDQNSKPEPQAASDNDVIKNPIIPMVGRLVDARAAFTAHPTPDRYAMLDRTCQSLADAVSALGLVKVSSKPRQCDGISKSNKLRAVFDSARLVESYRNNCLLEAQSKTTLPPEETVSRAQHCIQIASLPPDIARDLRAELRTAALYRDDQAHPLIVSWNAFSDTNPLAYLALVIAITIDGLVFCSGLLGAAVRSPERLSSLAWSEPFETADGSIAGNETLPGKTSVGKRELATLSLAVAHDGRALVRHMLETATPIGDFKTALHEYDLRKSNPKLKSLAARVLNAGMLSGLVRHNPITGKAILTAAFLPLVATLKQDRRPGIGQFEKSFGEADPKPFKSHELSCETETELNVCAVAPPVNNSLRQGYSSNLMAPYPPPEMRAPASSAASLCVEDVYDNLCKEVEKQEIAAELRPARGKTDSSLNKLIETIADHSQACEPGQQDDWRNLLTRATRLKKQRLIPPEHIMP